MATVVVYQFAGAYGLDSLSPFCSKVEAYLRLTKTPYDARPGNPLKAPRGKLPYVELDGEKIPDSQEIIAHLEAMAPKPLDAGLSPAEHNLGHLARRTVEEHLYFALLCIRWADEDTWQESYRDAIRATMPGPAALFVPALARRSVLKLLQLQGIGRLTQAGLAAAVHNDLTALEHLLGNSAFLLRDEPTTYDCSVHAIVEHLRRTPAAHPARTTLDEHSALLAYADRMNQRLGW